MTYPANEPPTQARHAGANAGALPAFAAALSDITVGGEGLFKMAKNGKRGRRGPYLSYGGGLGLSGRV